MSNVIFPGKGLTPGTGITSNSGRFTLTLQTDGDLVIIDNSYQPPSLVWHSNTAGREPGFVTYNTVGGFVLFDKFNGVLWQIPGAAVHTPSMAVMQDDGNFVIYGIVPVWASRDDPAAQAIVNPPAAASGINWLKTLQEVAGTGETISTVLDIVGAL